MCVRAQSTICKHFLAFEFCACMQSHLMHNFTSTFFFISQVITIFSASNYYEIGSNKGAYLKLNPQLDTHFVQYTAAASKTRKLTFRQKVGLVESSAIRELGAKLRERRNELEREFKARDPDSRGNTHTHRKAHYNEASAIALFIRTSDVVLFSSVVRLLVRHFVYFFHSMLPSSFVYHECLHIIPFHL